MLVGLDLGADHHPTAIVAHRRGQVERRDAERGAELHDGLGRDRPRRQMNELPRLAAEREEALLHHPGRDALGEGPVQCHRKHQARRKGDEAEAVALGLFVEAIEDVTGRGGAKGREGHARHAIAAPPHGQAARASRAMEAPVVARIVAKLRSRTVVWLRGAALAVVAVTMGPNDREPYGQALHLRREAHDPCRGMVWRKMPEQVRHGRQADPVGREGASPLGARGASPLRGGASPRRGGASLHRREPVMGHEEHAPHARGRTHGA